MSTGVESFAKIDELGAIYPMVGSEWLLTIIAVVFLLVVLFGELRLKNMSIKR